MSKAFDEVKRGSFIKQYIDTVTAYAAAVMLYGNDGMISNLTISEFELREEEENDKVVIPCVHHKTASQGMAQLKQCCCTIMRKFGQKLSHHGTNTKTSFSDI